MALLHRISSLLRNLFRGRKTEHDLNEEVRSFLDLLTEKNIKLGKEPTEARRLALVELGGVDQVKEKVREARMSHYLETMLQDLRYGVRMLAKSPVLTTVAVLSLALGIGANTAIFSLIDAVLLKMLPVDHPEQLVFISNVGLHEGGGSAPPYPCFERFRDNTHFLSGMAASAPIRPKVEIGGQIEEVNGRFVSGNYFSLLGVNMMVGRAFTSKDDSIPDTGGPDGPVAVIGYTYWKRRFAGESSVIGKVIQVDKNQVTIIGVTPAEFLGMTPGDDVDINLPIMLAGHQILADKGSWWFSAIGRVKPGASPEQARSEMNAIFQGYMDELPSISNDMRRAYFDHIQFDPAGRGQESLRSNYSRPLRILMIVVALVLLIACANIANLLLARATSRRREFAVRLAIGASRSRIFRQTLTESLLFVSLGGALGLWLASWSGDLLIKLLSTGREQIVLDLRLNARVLLFTIGVSLLTGIIFSIAPAMRSTRIDPGPELKDKAASSSNNRSRGGLGKLLVVGQVALSLLLLVGAGLFLRTLQNLKSLDAGFRPEGVLTMSIDPEAHRFKRAQRMAFWQDTLERIKKVPNARATSLSTLTPLDGMYRGVMVEVPGFSPRGDSEKEIGINHVSPDYFSTIGIPILNGRSFNERDNDTATRVCLLNETAARFYFGNRDPIGIKIGFSRPSNAKPYEIVGVVKDAKYAGIRESIERLIYIPTTQPIDDLRSLTLAIRTSGNPHDLVTPISNEIHSIGSGILVTRVLTLDEQINQTLILERLVSSLSNVFGLLALVLTCIGLYGLMSYEVARRTQEIGIRLAIGANTRNVIVMVMRETMVMVTLGIAAGVITALISTHYISSLLFGLTPNDPLTIVFAALLLMGIAALSGYLPARRAARIDPMVALRYE